MSLIKSCGYFIIILSSIQVANAHQCGGVCQDGARTIGSNNRIQYEAEERSRGRLYLNIENPAQCNGTITSWEYCCYLPQNRGVYQVYFAIYRRREVGHGKQKNIQYQNQNQILNLSVDHDDMDGGFVCNSFVPTEHISVQQGDIIGICLPGTNSLDIVSNTSTCDRTRSHTNSERSCTSTNSQRSPTNSTLLYLNREVHCSNTGIPGTINVNQHNKIIEFQGNRIAHLYAQINSKIILSS